MIFSAHGANGSLCAADVSQARRSTKRVRQRINIIRGPQFYLPNQPADQSYFWYSVVLFGAACAVYCGTGACTIGAASCADGAPCAAGISWLYISANKPLTGIFVKVGHNRRQHKSQDADIPHSIRSGSITRKCSISGHLLDFT